MSATTGPFVWNGITTETIGDLSDAMLSVKTPEEAKRFMAVYRQTNEHADSNIGYLSGYHDADTMRRVQDWFGVRHPVFG